MLWNMLMIWKTSRQDVARGARVLARLPGLRRLAKEEDGMEMVEWAIVATVFAIAAAAVWGVLEDDISSALDSTGTVINP